MADSLGENLLRDENQKPTPEFDLWPLGAGYRKKLSRKSDNYCQPAARSRVTETTESSIVKDETRAETISNETNEPSIANDDDQEANNDPIGENGLEEENNGTNSESEFSEDDAHDDSKAKKIEEALFDKFKVPLESHFYDYPDLKIVVISDEGDEHTFFVSSHSLNQISDNWRRLANPTGFREPDTEPHGTSTIKTIRLAEDDPKALWLIFKLAHHQVDDIPLSLSYAFLRTLAITCDKYDCGKFMKNLSLGWLKRWSFDDRLPYGREDWVFIARAFRPEMANEGVVAPDLLRESTSKSTCGTYFIRQPDRLSGDTAREVDIEFVPDDVLTFITQQRAKVIANITYLIREFASTVAAPGRRCRNGLCRAIALGSLIKISKKLDLWPLLNPGEAETWHGSPDTLVDAIIDLSNQVQTYIHGKADLDSSDKDSDISEDESEYKGSNVTIEKSSLFYRKPKSARKIEFPIFEGAASKSKKHAFLNGYEPCEMAFLLGELRDDCRRAFYDSQDATATFGNDIKNRRSEVADDSLWRTKLKTAES